MHRLCNCKVVSLKSPCISIVNEEALASVMALRYVFSSVLVGVLTPILVDLWFKMMIFSLIYLKWITNKDHGTLLNFMWQSGWKWNLGEIDTSLCIG